MEYSIYAADNELANARMFGHDIAGDMNGGASSFIGWSIVFDQDGGPNHVNNLCDAPILYDTRTDTLHKTLSYYYIGHFSRVIVPGSIRIGMSRYTDKIDVAAFMRPDGRFAVVLMNRTQDAKKVFIRLGGQVTMVEQRGGEFAVNYREYIKEHFAEDIGLDYKTGNDVKNDVANCVLAGLVEIMLYELSSEIIPDEFTYKIGDGIIKKGVARTLNEDLNIKFGK